MLPIRATKGKGEMEICQMDQSVKGFRAKMTWIHFGVKVVFSGVQGAFQITIWLHPLTCCCFVREGLRAKAINFAINFVGIFHGGIQSESSSARFVSCICHDFKWWMSQFRLGLIIEKPRYLLRWVYFWLLMAFAWGCLCSNRITICLWQG